MKKAIALIISVIVVVAIFASCDSAIEDVATTNEKAETNVVDTKATSEENLDGEGEENIVPGFYLDKKDQLLDVGSEVPKYSELTYFDSRRRHVYYYVHDGKQYTNLRNDWFNSGNTAYYVKKFGEHEGDPIIYLIPKS